MSSSEQKSFDISIQAYRRVLRIYPKGFLCEFEEQLVQSFGDLSRRALKTGGTLRLLLLWMRIVPDLLVSAIREHFGVSAWSWPRHVRLRWVLASSFGFGFGSLASDQLNLLAGPQSELIRSVFIMFALGLLQSAWAFQRPAGDVLRWTAATVLGMFSLALPLRIAVFGWSLDPVPQTVTTQLLFTVLHGTGIGLLQFFVLPRGTFKAWRWIPTNAFAAVLSSLAAMLLVYATHLPRRTVEVLPFFTGALFGALTCIPLGSIFSSRNEDSLEGVRS